MPLYMIQATYSPHSWASMVAQPQNRLDIVRPTVERLGGRLEYGWFTFGEYDIVVVLHMPDDARMASFAMAVKASGAVTNLKTTPLLTDEEAVRAQGRAGTVDYIPPFEIVDEAGEESFPASDPPSWNPG